MNRRPACLTLLLCLLVGALALGQQIKPRLLAESDGQSYWLVRVEPRANQTPPVETTVLQRVDPVTNTWRQLAQLRANVIDAAPVGEQLAVLLEGGEWRLFDRGGSRNGTTLPAPYQPIKFAGDGEALLAVVVPAGPSSQPATAPTTQPALPAILRWNGSTWSRQADLPADAEPSLVSLASIDGQMYLAYALDDQVRIVARRDGTWSTLASVPRRGDYRLLGNAPGVMIAQQDEQGVWTVLRPPADEPVRSFERHAVSDVVVIGATLRLVFVDQHEIKQLAYDDYGAGAPFGPTVVGQLPRVPVGAMWMEIGFIALLIVTMLLTLRQQPMMSTSSTSSALIVIAPLSRRFAAGVIDALPLALWLLDVPLQVSGGVVMGPFAFLGLAIYVTHVSVSELIWARSLGKYLFGLRVVSYDGSRPAAGTILLRNLMRLVDYGMAFLPLLLIPLTPMRQRIGDLAARTLVVIDKPAGNDAPGQ